MTDKEKLLAIRVEIERLKAEQLAIFSKGEDEDSCGDALTHIGAYNQLLSFINSLLEEPVSEDLEKAAEEQARSYGYMTEDYEFRENVESFKAGAEWQKEQMMAKAIDGDITFDYYGDDDKTYGCIAHDSFCLEDFGLKDTDKVKVIILKDN